MEFSDEVVAVKKRKPNPFWLLCIVFLVLAALTKFCLVGYSFSALIFCAIAAAFFIYGILRRMKNKEAARSLTIMLTILICVILTAAAVTGMVVGKASRGQPERNTDYIVVLGAGVNGTVPSLSLRERINATYAYLSAHPKSIAVVSGCQGSGEDISEAQCMFNELTKMGIAPDRVWMESQAENTRQNLQYSLELIQERTGNRPREVGIVSSEYHLYRAGFFAAQQGIDSFGIPARTSWLSLRINYYLREIAAVWYYCVFGG